VHAGAKRESAVPARERYIKYGPGSYRNVFYIRFRIFYIAGAKRERAVPAGAPLAPPSSPHSLALQAQRMVPAHRPSPARRRPYPAEWPKAAAGDTARDSVTALAAASAAALRLPRAWPQAWLRPWVQRAPRDVTVLSPRDAQHTPRDTRTHTH
jgi:hypothetical protein